MTAATSRVNEPLVVDDSKTWRLGKFRLERQFVRKGNDDWRLGYGDIYRLVTFTKLKWAFGLHLSERGEGVHLSLFGFWLQLPIKPWRPLHQDAIIETWGASILDDALHLNWGHRSKLVWLPWGFEHIESEHKILMQKDMHGINTWQTDKSLREANEKAEIKWYGFSSCGAPTDGRYWSEWPFKYLRHNGEVQERTARLTVEKRVWRRRCLPTWFPLFKMRKTYMDVAFSDEVGERTGSWKGGTMGCSMEMLPGERPIDTLRRMEATRRFN